jgi:hypothetical protein
VIKRTKLLKAIYIQKKKNQLNWFFKIF